MKVYEKPEIVDICEEDSVMFTQWGHSTPL